MTALLADNSNRTTKLVLGDAGGLRENTLERLPSRALSAGDLSAYAARHGTPDILWFCSVTQDGASRLREWAATAGIPACELTADNVPLDLSHLTPPSAIGADRLANALAASHIEPRQPSIAIDGGTALTFTIVVPVPDALPRVPGGAIAPGLSVFTRWLHESTSRLPVVDFPRAETPATGRSTQAAMQSAAWHGAKGMLRAILDAQLKECGDARLIATGSDGPLLSRLLGRPEIFHPHLTLVGLWHAAFGNQSEG